MHGARPLVHSNLVAPHDVGTVNQYKTLTATHHKVF